MQNATQQLWDDFLQHRSLELKRKLVVQYLDLVRYVVSKYNLHQQARTQGLEFDDVVHFGIMGLLTAVDRFMPAQNVKFETYAVPRIRGAILDEMRKLDWVPRSVRENSRRVGKAVHDVSQEHGREPLEEEIASKLELSLEEYHKLIGGGNAVPSRDTEYMVESESAEALDAAPSDGPSPFDRISDQETRAILLDAVEHLSERDRTVVALYYYEGLKFTEIAKVLSISEGRVSQIHSEVLRSLRNKLVAMEA
jgi:RNA polymerase sigma factor FliA